MKNFKKLFAMVFTAAVVVFGVLIMIDERDFVSSVFTGQLSFADETETGISILAIIILVIDILLIALPTLGFFLSLAGVMEPYKAIVAASLVVLSKFLITIFAFMLLMIVWQAPADVWTAYLFATDSLVIIPLVVFFISFLFLIVSTAKRWDGTLIRGTLATIGAGLAIFGLVFYFIFNGSDALIGISSTPDFLTIFGLVVGIACFSGVIIYSYLPKTRETSRR